MEATKITALCWAHAEGYSFNDWQTYSINMSCRPIVGDYIRIRDGARVVDMKIVSISHDVFDISKNPFLRIWLEEDK